MAFSLRSAIISEYNELKEKYNISEKDFIAIYVKNKYKDPKLVLISIILSQNTTDKNALLAFNNYLPLYKDNVRDLDKIKNAIRSAGLFESKSKYILNVLDLDLDKIIKMQTKEARANLIKIEGIGNKTADVFLALYGHKVFPVDTHIARIGKRLGIGKNYREISNYFLENLGSDIKYHMALITHGRYICLARNPKCNECYINQICEYYKKKLKNNAQT